MFLSITISMALYMISQLYHVSTVIVIHTLFICNRMLSIMYIFTVDNSSNTKHLHNIMVVIILSLTLVRAKLDHTKQSKASPCNMC